MPNQVEPEVVVCIDCDAKFERRPGRGRRPKKCIECRSRTADKTGQQGHRIHRDLRALVRGPMPNEEEKAIYFLRDEYGAPFYAGKSSNPVSRMAKHLFDRFPKVFTMVVVKVVPDSIATIEEARLIVELADKGLKLENK